MSEGRQPATPFAGLSLLVAVEEEGWETMLAGEPEAFVRSAVDAACTRAGLAPGITTELGVTLAGDEAVRTLNEEWRGKDKPTNVLSFPMAALSPGEAPGPLMGDLILSLQTCRAEAAAEGKAFADHAAHLLVHGVLHLLGHDHLDEASAEEMERLERLALADLSIEDPYRAAGEDEAAEPTDIRRWTRS